MSHFVKNMLAAGLSALALFATLFVAFREIETNTCKDAALKLRAFEMCARSTNCMLGTNDLVAVVNNREVLARCIKE